jgi:hypothetical protein
LSLAHHGESPLMTGDRNEPDHNIGNAGSSLFYLLAIYRGNMEVRNERVF